MSPTQSSDIGRLQDRKWIIQNNGHDWLRPCSIKTMSELANGVTGNLLARAGDVALEGTPSPCLVVKRNASHRDPHQVYMLLLTESGAIIAPPVPAFCYASALYLTTWSNIRSAECSTSLKA